MMNENFMSIFLMEFVKKTSDGNDFNASIEKASEKIKGYVEVICLSN